jgi:hypothetical protein
MHKNATNNNKTQSKWCINKHGASKIIDTFETYHTPSYKELTSSEQERRRKIKAKRSTREREHSLNDKSEN